MATICLHEQVIIIYMNCDHTVVWVKLGKFPVAHRPVRVSVSLPNCPHVQPTPYFVCWTESVWAILRAWTMTYLEAYLICSTTWGDENRSHTSFLLTPSSHSRKGRIERGRTLSTYLIAGSQTVQRYQHSRTSCVQCWPTHPTLVRLARLSISCHSLSSSMQLTMKIKSRLTPTTFSYPCIHSLTNEHSSSRVSR